MNFNDFVIQEVIRNKSLKHSLLVEELDQSELQQASLALKKFSELSKKYPQLKSLNASTQQASKYITGILSASTKQGGRWELFKNKFHIQSLGKVISYLGTLTKFFRQLPAIINVIETQVDDETLKKLKGEVSESSLKEDEWAGEDTQTDAKAQNNQQSNNQSIKEILFDAENGAKINDRISNLLGKALTPPGVFGNLFAPFVKTDLIINDILNLSWEELNSLVKSLPPELKQVPVDQEDAEALTKAVKGDKEAVAELAGETEASEDESETAEQPPEDKEQSSEERPTVETEPEEVAEPIKFSQKEFLHLVRGLHAKRAMQLRRALMRKGIKISD